MRMCVASFEECVGHRETEQSHYLKKMALNLLIARKEEGILCDNFGGHKKNKLNFCKQYGDC